MADPGIKPFAGRVTRLAEAPLIAAEMFSPAQIAGLEPDALANINGPSILRMPDWATGRRGTFHMYFAHKGRSIRMAWPMIWPVPGRCIPTRCWHSPTACSSPKTRRLTTRCHSLTGWPA